MRPTSIYSFVILVACGLFAGCAQPAAPEAETTTAANASAPAAAANTSEEKQTAEAPANETPKSEPAKPAAVSGKATPGTPVSNATASAAPPAPFHPPYPQRENMFRRPNTDNNKNARAETNNAIELKGFVNLGGLKAVLVIDGKTVALKQGEQRGEIEVIEVTPPKVILQRGRARWTTQLFEPAVNRTAAVAN